MRTIGDIPRLGAKRRPEKVALVLGDVHVTYRELNTRVDRVARGLAERGVGRRDRVAVLADDGIELLVIAFAAAKLGAWFVPVNTRYGPQELRFVLADVRPDVLFVGPGHEAAAAGATGGGQPPVLVALVAGSAGDLSFADLLGSGDAGEPVTAAGPADIATVLYTSGTTGDPKGVLATHGATMALLPVYAVEGDLGGDDVVLVVMPLFHGGGLVMGVLPALAFGATVVLAGRGFDPGRVLRQVEQHRVTATLWSPTMLAMLVRDGRPAQHDTSSLTKIWYGSSGISADVLARARAAFPGAGFYQWYGTTEATTIAVLRPEDHADRAHCTGREVFLVDAWVADEGGAPAAEGQVGELVVSAPLTGMVGYHGDDAATREAVRGGVLHTGDLARREPDGYFTVVDRAGDLIVSGGENIRPREVEDVIRSMDGVLDAAVFGVPDPVYGQSVAAAVVLAPGAGVTAAAVADHTGARIARYKRPTAVTFVPELPRNASGKVVKGVLRARAAARTAGP